MLPIVTLLFQRTIREDTSGRYCTFNLMCRRRTHGLRGCKATGLSLALSQCSSRRILTVHPTAPLMNSLTARADATGLACSRKWGPSTSMMCPCATKRANAAAAPRGTRRSSVARK